jgi:hypothetical protein
MPAKYSLICVVVVAFVFWYLGAKWPITNLPVVGKYL